MRGLRVFTVLLILVVVCGVVPGGARQAAPAPAAPAEPAAVMAVAEGNMGFALHLYQQLRSQQGNLFFSPYSISLALAMTYAGARGETERQMAQAMDFRLPQDQLHPAFHALSEELASRAKPVPGREGEPFSLHLANSLWGQQGHPFLPAFLELEKRDYGAGMRLVDFGKPEAARGTINRWVSDETQGKIVDLIPPGVLDEATRLVLANAIYFKASWEGRFERKATEPGPFTLLNGEKVTVPLMHQSIFEEAAEGQGWQAVELPYVGHKLAMVVLLPAAGTFPQFQESLTPARLQEILSSMKLDHVNVTLPRFDYTSSFRLDKALMALGLRDAFEPRADFSGMDGKRDLSISAVLHKAMVKVNEEGTEAAAATAVAMRLSARVGPPMEFVADRPFLFLIRDIPTGTILFMGRVVDPR